MSHEKKISNEIFKRLRTQEEATTKIGLSVEQMSEAIRKLESNLTQHSHEEITKATELNKTLQQINTNVENQTHKTELLSLKLDSMDKDLKDSKKDLREDIDRVDKKAEDAMHVAEKVKEKILIWSGGIAAVMAVGCIIWVVYSQMKQDNDKLEERLRKYEINQGINYGRQQGSK